MKIALITIWREKNYGAELQAYATIKVLQELGHEVKMIDIRLSDYPRLNWKGRTASLISQLGPAHKKFCDFWKKNIPVTRRYKKIEYLMKNPPEADVYLVGSDQVWNPEVTGDLSMLYFLNFGSADIKRVSYASSFGTDCWRFPEIKNEVRTLLDRFSCVTCRESSGVRILEEEFGIKACHVLDPTLLIDSYKELVGETNGQRTLLYYPLGDDPELELYSLSLAKELGLEAKNGNRRTKLLGKIEWNRPDITEWVRNIAEAEFVITRSFHGMVFSIMHERQFAVLADCHGRGTRLKSLLKQLGLEDRFYDSLEDLNSAKPWIEKIDYTTVTPKLFELRKKSIAILRRSLEM